MASYTKGKFMFCPECKRVYEHYRLDGIPKERHYEEFPFYGLKKTNCDECDRDKSWTVEYYNRLIGNSA